MEKMLSLFTFLPLDNIKELIVLHQVCLLLWTISFVYPFHFSMKENPSERLAQKKLATEVVRLVHGGKTENLNLSIHHTANFHLTEKGFKTAEKCSNILFGKNKDVINLIDQLDNDELQTLFKNASTTELQYLNEMSLLDICMAANCFKRRSQYYFYRLCLISSPKLKMIFLFNFTFSI